MNYKSFNLGDWIGHISGVIEDETTLDGNEMRDLVEFLSGLPKWISVNERLPEDGTLNLFTDGMTVSVERYKADALDHFYPDGRWFSLDEVIAWMPLPKPYEPMESEG